MTAALEPRPRPTLYLVPGRSGPPRRGATGRRAGSTVPPAALPGLAAAEVARVLGTLFAPVARELARQLAARAPLELRRGRPEVWAAAIAFLLAEEAALFHYDRCPSRSAFAGELGVTLQTLRRRSADLRRLLHPLVLDLPDPDPERA